MPHAPQPMTSCSRRAPSPKGRRVRHMIQYAMRQGVRVALLDTSQCLSPSCRRHPGLAVLGSPKKRLRYSVWGRDHKEWQPSSSRTETAASAGHGSNWNSRRLKSTLGQTLWLSGVRGRARIATMARCASYSAQDKSEGGESRVPPASAGICCLARVAGPPEPPPRRRRLCAETSRVAIM
jgi:hypothetical protein